MITGPGDDTTAAEGRGDGHLRASDADRERAIGTLKAAFVQERLTKEELDTRVGQVLVSRTYAELAAVTADLPAGPAAAQQPESARARGERPVPRTGPVIMAATTMYAAVWPVALSLPRDSEGEPMAGINLIGVTTAFYVLVVIIAVTHALNSRLEKRSGRRCRQTR